MPRDLENCEPLERAGGKIIQVRRKMGRARDLYIVHGISEYSRKKGKTSRGPYKYKTRGRTAGPDVVKDTSKCSIAQIVAAGRGTMP